MKKLVATAALLVAASPAHAAKLTYTKADLEAAGANNVPGIVDRYLADSGRTSLIHPGKVLFLLDGRRVADAAAHLAKSDRVEVLSDGDSLVINVVTRPAGRGG